MYSQGLTLVSCSIFDRMISSPSLNFKAPARFMKSCVVEAPMTATLSGAVDCWVNPTYQFHRDRRSHILLRLGSLPRTWCWTGFRCGTMHQAEHSSLKDMPSFYGHSVGGMNFRHAFLRVNNTPQSLTSTSIVEKDLVLLERGEVIP
jgi:hypothetical protein